jgi:hydroxymethylglutaryl-CoA reductase (NADPH)
MPADGHRAASQLRRLQQGRRMEELEARLAPKTDDLPAPIPGHHALTRPAVDARWGVLREVGPNTRAALADERTMDEMERYARNIENFIGTVKLPVGLAGPLRVNGLFAQGDYYLPLATTEATLVASYSRGAQLLTEAGGCSAMLLNEGVSRSPGFVFDSLRECGLFAAWAIEEIETFKRVAQTTTRHGELIDMRVTIEGNHVYLSFEYATGDAAGQNMVTIATDAILAHVEANSPVRARYSFIDANLSGDKKASAHSFMTVRGKKVTAEVNLPRALVEKRLHTTPEHLAELWRISALGGVLSGTIGVQGHYANGLTALYLACGQDSACVAESAVGVTRFEVTQQGGLYASVTLPNVIVGTVGGGTGLPSQQACLEILGLAGPGNARAFAELCAAVCLAGELSICGAVCSGDFARAHQMLARGPGGRG